jgi:hypothetical protein
LMFRGFVGWVEPRASPTMNAWWGSLAARHHPTLLCSILLSDREDFPLFVGQD